MSNRVVRCSMFVTPTNPRFIDKAWTRGADVYTLDIEDSIPPAEKERCRSLIREYIHKANKGGASIYVRINKPFVDADLPCSVWPGVDRIMLPKTESAAEMIHAEEIITRLEKDRGVPEGYIELSPMLESALGVVNIYEILTATSRKIWSIGASSSSYDMSLNLGTEMFVGFEQVPYIGAYVVLAAMTLGIEATGGIYISNPTGRVDQSDQAIREAAAFHAAGIHQAGALHPAHVLPLVSGLSPTQDEIKWANRVIEEYNKLADAGESVGKLDGKVIDKYEYDMAQRTIVWANACATKDKFKERALAGALAEEQKEK